MKRHPSLQDLSRDHHQALLLARTLTRIGEAEARPAAPLPAPPSPLVDAASGADADGEDPLAACRARFLTVVAPHFLLEERELVPLSLCHPELRPMAEAVLDQHRTVREGFNGLHHGSAATLGAALADHVRFEERQWFPALEARLTGSELSALAHRLKATPEVATVSFERETDGVFIAHLACGHRQHIRHNPPFQEAAWVATEEGRQAHLGMRLPCPLCRMPRLPPCAVPYRTTPTYDSDTIPAGLLRSHRLQPGTWARISVRMGHVQYVLEDAEDLTVVLRPGVDGIVAPERPHHVRLHSGSQVSVEFLRLP